MTIFRDGSPARLIAVLKPDVHCKGTDYTPESVPEREIVLGYGGRIAIVGDPLPESFDACHFAGHARAGLHGHEVLKHRGLLHARNVR